MGQTIRRQPGSVDVPSKDYIYHKNLIGFKGLDTRENPLVTDPLSCSDAKNVWVDANGNLTQRPRLQWVRRDLKVQDSDVVNVIYTDKAYWTLYYKEGIYSLTRTDLTTSTVTLFTIPEMTSPKIGITEFQGTYYLGCSSGYYSCIAGQTKFTAVTGYVPVGSITDTGIVYTEPQNILNTKIRIPITSATDLSIPTHLQGNIISTFSTYVLVRYDLGTTIYFYIIDTVSHTIIATLSHVFSALPIASVYHESNESIYVAISEPGKQPIFIYHIILSNGVFAQILDYIIDTIFFSPLVDGDNDKQNTFTGINNALDDSPYSLLYFSWAIDNEHVYLNVSVKYLQWDYEHRVNRHTPATGLSIETGQWCFEGISIDITGWVNSVTQDNIQTLRKTMIRRCGIYVYAEHTAANYSYCLLHLARDNNISKAVSETLVIYATSVTNSTQSKHLNVYTANTSRYTDANNIYNSYVTGANDLIKLAYPQQAMVYYKEDIPLHSPRLVIDIIGYTWHSMSITLIHAAATPYMFRTYTVVYDNTLKLTRDTDITADTLKYSTDHSWPRYVIVNNKMLYRGNILITDISAFAESVSNVFVVDALLIDYKKIPHTFNIVSPIFAIYSISETEVPSIRGVLFLDNVYWWFGETSIYGTMNDDLTYLPETRKLDAPSKILNWVRLTDTSFIVFCESDTVIYYKDSSGLWLRTVLNLPFEIISPDETSEACYAALNTGPTYVTRNGIYEIALSENLFTNERQAQNISMTLATLEGGLLQKIIPNLLHIQTVRYKDWQLFIFKRQAGLTEVIAQEISTYNYFYWTLPIDFVSTYLAEGEVYLVDKNAITYKLTETELLREYKNGDTVIASVKCYGDEVFNETKQVTELKQIDWFWHSAVLNLDTIQYYKTLLALIFGMNDYDDASRVMFEYQTDIYYKSHTEQPVKVYDDYVYKIRNTQKQAAIPRFMYIRVRCESVPIPDTPDCLPEEFMCKVNLSQITFKYKVLRGSLL